MVSSVKLLILNISKGLKCRELSRVRNFPQVIFKVLFPQATEELITHTCIRPVMEYASPVFHNSLPNYLSDEKEGLQRRAMRIIFPHVAFPIVNYREVKVVPIQGLAFLFNFP